MASVGPIVVQDGALHPSAVLREIDEWGLRSADLVSPPRRLWSDAEGPKATVEAGVDVRRLRKLPTPAQLLECLPDGDTWAAQTKRSVARFAAFFLISEDPQRRLDARAVSTLSHQISLVRHILDGGALRRVLIADEVGLGKTVEAGLLVKELLERTPGLRVLYLAPARLVNNVRAEFERLGLAFRQWTSVDGDARLSDSRVIASIHRAVHGDNLERFTRGNPWDILIVDECHHLSDWAPGGGDPREKFKLVRELIAQQSNEGRVVLLSGTPHQGHVSRFENLLGLLRDDDEPLDAVAGRVIYRTKDEIRDWSGRLLFPRREVREPIVVDLGPQYRAWVQAIHAYYRPNADARVANKSWRRAAGWRCAQALQWAASSPHAGLGYLVRQAMRADWNPEDTLLCECLGALRPYRGGPADEPIAQLFARISKEIGRQRQEADIEDIEDETISDRAADREGLASLLRHGLEILRRSADEKWDTVWGRVLRSAGDEKVVLFAQPIETVTALAAYLARTTGETPAIIIGGQSDAERQVEVDNFRRDDGPRYLISSRAGGEGINLQVARRLVHIDVPWNPMDLEQRVGRVHRFGSRRTIVVDTIVVKDSREADAYRVARQKLRLIAETMVEPGRFESVFSRVMCLMPPDALQDVLINDATSPLTHDDQESIARMVREGFRAWSDFDSRFSEQQNKIRQLNPGLAAWKDLSAFAQKHAGATLADGFVSQRFTCKDGEIESVEESAEVLQLPDGRCYACGEFQGAPVFGPNSESALQLGLNVKPVAEALRRVAFPTISTGAAHLRWSAEIPLPAPAEGRLAFGALAFLRQTLKTEPQAGWVEIGTSLCCCVLNAGETSPVLLEAADKRRLFDGLSAATVRVKPHPDDNLTEELAAAEQRVADELRRPTDEDIALGVRHAVTPVLAAVFVVER